jgi:protein SCO1/2
MRVPSLSRRSLLAAVAAAPLVLALAACGDSSPHAKAPEFQGTDITGTDIGNDLNMVDTQGKPRVLADFKGKVTVFFFGFTQCPDVCPTAMAQLAQALELLGDQAGKVQVVLISVDPERDTREILQQYVQTFNPTFMGLTGSADQLASTARSFKAYYAKVPGSQPGQYTMDHAASFYVFDTDAKARVLISGSADPETIAADLKQLL